MAWFRRGKKSEDVTSATSETPGTSSDAEGARSTGPASSTGPSSDAVDLASDAVDLTSTTGAPGTDETAPARAALDVGPYDAANAPDTEGYLRLGSIWVPAVEGLMLTFEMDQSQSQVTAVQVVLGDSSLQLQAFAAPKSSGLWSEIRGEIAEGLTAQGGEAVEEEGDYGTELLVSTGGTRMRFLGVDGPRWFLRGVLSGRAAEDRTAAAGLRAVFAHVVVDRGGEPMGPRELLTLRLPDDEEQPAEEPGRSAADLDPFTRGPEITEIR